MGEERGSPGEAQPNPYTDPYTDPYILKSVVVQVKNIQGLVTAELADRFDEEKAELSKKVEDMLKDMERTKGELLREARREVHRIRIRIRIRIEPYLNGRSRMSMIDFSRS